MKTNLSILLFAFSVVSAMAQPTATHLVSSGLSDAAGSACTVGHPYCAPYPQAEYQSIRYPDLNGDHLPDICYLDANGIQCALFSPRTNTFVGKTPKEYDAMGVAI